MVRFSNVFLSIPFIAIVALVKAAPFPQSRSMQPHNNEEKTKRDWPIFSDNSYTNCQRTEGIGPSQEDAVEHGLARLQPTEGGTASATTFSVGEPVTFSSSQDGQRGTSFSSSSSPETTSSSSSSSSSSSPAPIEPVERKWTTTFALTTAYVLLTGLACVSVVWAPEEAKLSDKLSAISPGWGMGVP